MRSLCLVIFSVLSVVSSAHADAIDAPRALFATPTSRDPWRIDWLAPGDPQIPRQRTLNLSAILVQQPTNQAPQPSNQPVHAIAIQHSDAYLTRAKIHKYASVATLPLFAADLVLGQSLFNESTPAGSKRGLHAAVGGGIIGLFGVNTVIGAWNMFGEGWQEKEGRTLRLVHGLLMMAADVGFVDTWATGPHSGRLRTALNFENQKTTHRNVAIASISLGSAGYLLMLLGNH
jgi:hypothetical protein